MAKLTKKILDAVRRQLNDHFEVDFDSPKIRVIDSPKTWARLYTGKAKDWSIEDLVRISEESSYYYNEDIKAILFKGFKRNGVRSFKSHPVAQVSLDQLVHEWIHHLQTMSGGYGTYNFFDEGCDEFSTYVLTASPKIYSDYWNFISRLWRFFDSIYATASEKYDAIRRYNVAEDKSALSSDWIATFLKTNRRRLASYDEESLMAQLESDDPLDPKIEMCLGDKTNQAILRDIYRIHDKLKPDLEDLFK